FHRDWLSAGSETQCLLVLHAEHAKAGVFNRGVQGGGQAQGQNAPGIRRLDDAVIPQTRSGVVGVAFMFVLFADGGLEGFFFLGAPALATSFQAITAHGSQHAGRLLTTHDRDAGIGPEKQQARAEGSATHAVVTGTKGAAQNHGELGDGRGRYGGDQLGAMTGNPFVLVLAAHHEAGDVLQEHQRRLALAAQFDEVGALLGRFGEQNAVVGNDAYRHAVDMGKAGHQRGAKAGLEFIKIRVIHNAGDDFAHIVGFAGVGRDDAVQLLRVVAWLANFFQRPRQFLLTVQATYAAARQLQRMKIVFGQMVGYAGQTGVYIATAQVFGADFFTGCGFDQWRATQEDGALVAHDDGFITHGWNV